jgi:hypothetical protein
MKIRGHFLFFREKNTLHDLDMLFDSSWLLFCLWSSRKLCSALLGTLTKKLDHLRQTRNEEDIQMFDH